MVGGSEKVKRRISINVFPPLLGSDSVRAVIVVTYGIDSTGLFPNDE